MKIMIQICDPSSLLDEIKRFSIVELCNVSLVLMLLYSELGLHYCTYAMLFRVQYFRDFGLVGEIRDGKGCVNKILRTKNHGFETRI